MHRGVISILLLSNVSDQNTRWTSEAGLQKLVLKFKFSKVEIFKLFKALLCKVYCIVMSQMVPYICEQLGSIQINCIVDDGEPWFKSIDIATALKYTDTDKAIRRHVADDDKRQQGLFDLNPACSGG